MHINLRYHAYVIYAFVQTLIFSGSGIVGKLAAQLSLSYRLCNTNLDVNDINQLVGGQSNQLIIWTEADITHVCCRRWNLTYNLTSSATRPTI